MTVLLGIPRCDHCGFESRLYELDDGTRLICLACICVLVDAAPEATDPRARCVHGRLVFAEGCDSCWLEARTRP